MNETDRIINNLSVINPKYASVTTTKEIAKNIILRGAIFNRGEMYRIIAKHQGLGIYELTLKKL